MPYSNPFSEQRIQGKVLDKYQLENGNLALIVEQERTGRRYSVEFKTDEARQCLENLYGIIDEPFRGKREYLERLITPDDHVEMIMSCNQSPIRTAYGLRTVSRPTYH